MFVGLMNTFSPNGGDGIGETVIVFLLIGALIYMNVFGIEVNETFNYVITTVIGYFVGKNAKKVVIDNE